MGARRKKNLVIALVLSILALPLFLISVKMQDKLVNQEREKLKMSSNRRPAVHEIKLKMKTE